MSNYFTDTGLTVGQRYEYLIKSNYYLLSAIRATAEPMEKRGKLILVVDNTVTNAIAFELEQFRTNLIGDGWTVLRTNVPRHDDQTWTNNIERIASIKAFITNVYYSDLITNPTKGIIMIGHVPVPYSGNIAPDGHTGDPGCHLGAWSADGYYADMDGTWTDLSIVAGGSGCTINPRNHNAPGDFRFDQNRYPPVNDISKPELIFGRIDFANLPDYASPDLPPGITPHGETDLLKIYFAKNSRYRHNLIALRKRHVVRDSLSIKVAHAMGLPWSSSWYGNSPEFVEEGNPFVQTNSYELGQAYGYGGFNYIQIDGVYYTTLGFASMAAEPPIGFYALEASYFGDWDSTNNFMRGLLSRTNYGFAAIWTKTAAGTFRLWGWENPSVVPCCFTSLGRPIRIPMQTFKRT